MNLLRNALSLTRSWCFAAIRIGLARSWSS